MGLSRYPLGTCLGTAALLVCAASTSFAYQEASVADGGSIKGKVTYNGMVQKVMVVPTKDKEVCGEPREEPDVAVGPDKGVGHAVAYLKGVQSGKAWPSGEKPAIDNKACRFEPPMQVVKPGPVTVVNSDPVLHNTHAFYGRRTAFNLALPNKDQRIETELPRPGMVRVECDAHGWMLGWVYVAENPYYAVTAQDGTFTIDQVPPGQYTLTVHQPALQPMEVPVTVKAKETAQVAVELKK
jgi:hypothetical protein